MTGKQFSLDSRMDLVQGIMSHGGVRHTSEPTSALPLMKEDSVEGVESGQKPTTTPPVSVKGNTQPVTLRIARERFRSLAKKCFRSALFH